MRLCIMSQRRARISPTVLAELARRVHPDQTTNRLQNYAAYTLGGLGFVWVMAAPILLLLLPFGVNFTVQWLAAGAYLFGLSFATVGFGFLVAAVLSHSYKQRAQYLLLGVGILVATTCFVILSFFGTSDSVSALLPVGVSCILAVILIGLSVFFFRTLQQHILLQLLYLIGAASFSIGIVVSTVIVQADRLPITPTTLSLLYNMQTIIQPIAWCSSFLALLGNNLAKQKRRS
jgi:hypothetical protein